MSANEKLGVVLLLLAVGQEWIVEYKKIMQEGIE
jgi:hypothetical protein